MAAALVAVMGGGYAGFEYTRWGAEQRRMLEVEAKRQHEVRLAAEKKATEEQAAREEAKRQADAAEVNRKAEEARAEAEARRRREERLAAEKKAAEERAAREAEAKRHSRVVRASTCRTRSANYSGAPTLTASRGTVHSGRSVASDSEINLGSCCAEGAGPEVKIRRVLAETSAGLLNGHRANTVPLGAERVDQPVSSMVAPSPADRSTTFPNS